MAYYFRNILILFSAIILASCSDSAPKNKYAQSQVDFCNTISTYRDMYNKELKKDFYIDQKDNSKSIYNARTNKLKTILANGKVDRWQGIISNITVSRGKGAYLEVQLSCKSSLEPQDNLLIPINSPLYQELRKYSENSKIIFSGNFLLAPDDTPHKYPFRMYYGEKSFTEAGSMREPEFLFKFSNFHNN